MLLWIYWTIFSSFQFDFVVSWTETEVRVSATWKKRKVPSTGPHLCNKYKWQEEEEKAGISLSFQCHHSMCIHILTATSATIIIPRTCLGQSKRHWFDFNIIFITDLALLVSSRFWASPACLYVPTISVTFPHSLDCSLLLSAILLRCTFHPHGNEQFICWGPPSLLLTEMFFLCSLHFSPALSQFSFSFEAAALCLSLCPMYSCGNL